MLGQHVENDPLFVVRQSSVIAERHGQAESKSEKRRHASAFVAMARR